MYNKLLKTITNKLQQFASENTFVTFKGFPNYFINEVSQKIPFHTDSSILFENDKINLKGIFNNLPDLISSLRNLSAEKHILLYEELIQLQKNYISLPKQQKTNVFPEL